MDEILYYLEKTYNPSGILIYGSFANGSNNVSSDFDVMLLYDGTKIIHDDRVIASTQLDAFIYPNKYICEDANIRDFLRIRDGKIYKDENGILSQLQRNVIDYILNAPKKTKEENGQSISWCRKMLHRTRRCDAEGLYRKYWLLTDSLEIFFDINGWFYPGPKKALMELAKTDIGALKVYSDALENPTFDTLNRWIQYIEESFYKD